MRRFRAVLAIVLALIWCGEAMHEQLEAAGWMFDHHHHHHTEEGHSHDPAGESADSHDPVFARDSLQEGRIAPASPASFAPVGALLAVSFGVSPDFVPDPRVHRIRFGRDGPLCQPWFFASRCAPESLAPPALS